VASRVVLSSIELVSELSEGNSVQNFLSSRLLPKNINNETIILPVVLYGCETWFLTLKKVHRLGVFENRVLRRIFRHRRDKVTVGESCIMRSYIS
jgi:hypothetical protein